MNLQQMKEVRKDKLIKVISESKTMKSLEKHDTDIIKNWVEKIKNDI